MRHLLSASSPALSGRSLCVAVALLRLAAGRHRPPPPPSPPREHGARSELSRWFGRTTAAARSRAVIACPHGRRAGSVVATQPAAALGGVSAACSAVLGRRRPSTSPSLTRP